MLLGEEDFDDVRRRVRGTDPDSIRSLEDDTEDPGSNHSWEQPSKKAAKEYGRATVFMHGHAPLWGTTPVDLAPLGEGVMLYFLLLKWFAWFFVAQSIIALPSIIYFIQGEAISDSRLDLLGIATTTLGNFHLDNITEWLLRYRSSSDEGISDEVWEQLNIIPERPYFRSYVISGLDLVNTFFFVAFIAWLKYQLRNMSKEADKRFVTVANYAIYVEGLPPDTTESEVREHFDRLYQLKSPDWTWPGYFKGWIGKKEARPPPATQQVSTTLANSIFSATHEDLQPVRDVSNINDPSYMGSWVCEVTLAHQQGAIIKSCLEQVHIENKLSEIRTAILKYRDPKHADTVREKVAVKELCRLEAKAATISAYIEKVRLSKQSQKCYGAFVIFQHHESQQRCLQDYQTYNKWWHRQPKPLRFRNGTYSLSVTAATEPTNIKWENHGANQFVLALRLLLVLFFSVLILMGAFTLVYWCQTQFRNLQELLPDSEMCIIDLPATIIGSYHFAKLSPTVLRKADLDYKCNASQIWLSYEGMETTDLYDDPCLSPCVDHPNTGKETTCYTLSVQEGCPSAEDPLEDANIDPVCALVHEGNSSETSVEISSELLNDPDSLERLIRAIDSVHCCKEFVKEATIRTCYCAQRLRTNIQEHGIFKALVYLDSEDNGFCRTEAKNMWESQMISSAPAVIVVTVNIIIRMVMARISKLERHTTVTQHERSLMLKILATQFITTALVVLVLNAASFSDDEGSVSKLRSEVFEAGDFQDFTRLWYCVVGQAIILTMALNVVSVQIFPIFLGYIVSPLVKLYYSLFAITQMQLNKAFSGLDFRITIRYAMLVNTIWVTMLYSASMPLVLVFAVLFFTCTYWFDKYAILRYYHRPPAYDMSFPELAVSLLPVALLGHTGFSFYAFANEDLFPSERVTWERLETLISGNSTNTGLNTEIFASVADWLMSVDRFEIVYKSSIIAALPQFTMTLCILVYYFSKGMFNSLYLLPKLRMAILYCIKTFRSLVARLPVFKQQSQIHPRSIKNLTKEDSPRNLPPFTGSFIRDVPADSQLTDLQKKNHWRMDKDLNGKHTYEYAAWPSSGEYAGKPHSKGDIMKTWELISTQSVHSYRLEHNPFYRLHLHDL